MSNLRNYPPTLNQLLTRQDELLRTLLDNLKEFLVTESEIKDKSFRLGIDLQSYHSIESVRTVPNQFDGQIPTTVDETHHSNTTPTQTESKSYANVGTQTCT